MLDGTALPLAHTDGSPGPLKRNAGQESSHSSSKTPFLDLLLLINLLSYLNFLCELFRLLSFYLKAKL